ncbi:hypothetical protein AARONPHADGERS_215 [Bacillus phage AaronPhadgers]|nr:hypothetical protein AARONPHADGERS_215 [Bacillus phage AaronPhadgers]
MWVLDKENMYKGISEIDFTYHDSKEGVTVYFAPNIPFYIVGKVTHHTFMSGEGYIIMNEECETITVDTALVEFYSGTEEA